MNAKETIREQIDLDWIVILGELVSDCKKSWGVTEEAATHDNVNRESCLSARFSPPAFQNAALLGVPKKTALKKTSTIFSAYLLAEFAAASLAAQLCPNLTRMRVLGISVLILCSSSRCCDLLLYLLGILTSSNEGARSRESFPITLFPALPRRPEDNSAVLKPRDHTCSSALRLTRSHAIIGFEPRGLSAQREVSSAVCPAADRTFLTFIATADVLAMLLFWGRGFVGLSGLLGSHPAAAVEKGYI